MKTQHEAWKDMLKYATTVPGEPDWSASVEAGTINEAARMANAQTPDTQGVGGEAHYGISTRAAQIALSSVARQQ